MSKLVTDWISDEKQDIIFLFFKTLLFSKLEVFPHYL